MFLHDLARASPSFRCGDTPPNQRHRPLGHTVIRDASSVAAGLAQRHISHSQQSCVVSTLEIIVLVDGPFEQCHE